MPATTTNLTVEQGTTWAHGWRVTYNAAEIDETWTFTGQVRANARDALVLHSWSGTVTEDGDVVIGLTAAESSAWDWREGVYDVEVVNAAGTVELRVAEGTFTVKAEVTRA